MPFPLTVELVDASNSRLKTPLDVGKPFQFRVTTKRNVRYVLVEVLEDGSARVQRSSLFDKDENLITSMSGAPFKITELVTGEKMGVIYYVLFAAETDMPLPLPTIVRSKHSGFPIYRFLFEPGKVEPAKVVRKVIPVSVKAE